MSISTVIIMHKFIVYEELLNLHVHVYTVYPNVHMYTAPQQPTVIVREHVHVAVFHERKEITLLLLSFILVNCRFLATMFS